MVEYAPTYVLGNLCIAAWLIFWVSFIQRELGSVSTRHCVSTERTLGRSEIGSADTSACAQNKNMPQASNVFVCINSFAQLYHVYFRLPARNKETNLTHWNAKVSRAASRHLLQLNSRSFTNTDFFSAPWNRLSPVLVFSISCTTPQPHTPQA